MAADVRVWKQAPTVAPIHGTAFDKILIVVLHVANGKVDGCDKQFVRGMVVGSDGRGRGIGSTAFVAGDYLIQVFVTTRSVDAAPERVLLATAPVNIRVSR